MRKIVIAPYVFHKGLISSYQKNDPFYNIKLISKEDVFAECFGRLDDSAIAELLKNSELDIRKINEILRFIPFANEESANVKIATLYKYNKDLKEKGFLKTNEYFPYLLKDKEIEIIGYSKDDKELTRILDNLNLNYVFNYGFKGHKSYKVVKYKDTLLESLDLLNNICDEIKKGKSPNEIFIYTNNSDLISYLKQFNSSFNLPINFNDSYSFATTDIGKELFDFIEKCDDHNEIKAWIENRVDDRYKTDLLKLIDANTYDFLSIENQKDLFKNAINNLKIRTDKYDVAVNVINKPAFFENATIFVPCFSLGSFPRVYKDNEYISDNEKEILGLNNSNVLTKISYWENMEFFDSNNEFHFSFAGEHLSNSYSISPIAIFNDYKEVPNETPKTIYSDDYRVFLQTISFDLFNVYKEQSDDYFALKDFDINYKNYDNSYTNVNHFNNDDKLKHSYTSLTEFYECPFKYYLERVLRVNKEDYGLAATIGTICHHIFEHMFDATFDFEKCYNETKTKCELNALENLIMDALKDQIKVATNAFLLHRYTYMTESYVFKETKSVIDLGENTKLEGRIDAAYIINKEYVVIIDYKSGSDKVDIKNIDYGVSLQLPIYAFLSRNDNRFSNYKIGGLYLQKFIEKKYSYEVNDDAIIRPILKLDGLSNIDQDFLNKFDFSFRDNGASQFINAIKKNKDGSVSKNQKILSETELMSLAEKAEHLARDADKRIRSNSFEIAPLKSGTSINACQYCLNKDICFVRSKQFNEIKKEEQENQ